jgi:hypothetical protein
MLRVLRGTRCLRWECEYNSARHAESRDLTIAEPVPIPDSNADSAAAGRIERESYDGATRRSWKQ